MSVGARTVHAMSLTPPLASPQQDPLWLEPSAVSGVKGDDALSLAEVTFVVLDLETTEDEDATLDLRGPDGWKALADRLAGIPAGQAG